MVKKVNDIDDEGTDAHSENREQGESIAA